MALEESMLQAIHSLFPKHVTRLGSPFRPHLFQVLILGGDPIEVCADHANQALALARLWGYATRGAAAKIN